MHLAAVVIAIIVSEIVCNWDKYKKKVQKFRKSS